MTNTHMLKTKQEPQPNIGEKKKLNKHQLDMTIKKKTKTEKTNSCTRTFFLLSY